MLNGDKRKTGKPAELMSGNGRQVKLFLDDESIRLAEHLGQGNKSLGARRALKQAAQQQGDGKMSKSDKITVVVGHKSSKPEKWDSMSPSERYSTEWKPESFHRPGFWKKEALAGLARKLGFVGEIKVSHTRMDYSGRGRTYDEDTAVIVL